MEDYLFYAVMVPHQEPALFHDRDRAERHAKKYRGLLCQAHSRN